MSRQKVADVLWYALECAKAERQSLVDAYFGDTNEWVVRESNADIKAFEALQMKLFGTIVSRQDATIAAMKVIDLKILIANSAEIDA